MKREKKKKKKKKTHTCTNFVSIPVELETSLQRYILVRQYSTNSKSTPAFFFSLTFCIRLTLLAQFGLDTHSTMAEDKKTAVKSLFGKKKGKPAGKLNLKVFYISFQPPKSDRLAGTHIQARNYINHPRTLRSACMLYG